MITLTPLYHTETSMIYIILNHGLEYLQFSYSFFNITSISCEKLKTSCFWKETNDAKIISNISLSKWSRDLVLYMRVWWRAFLRWSPIWCLP